LYCFQGWAQYSVSVGKYHKLNLPVRACVRVFHCISRRDRFNDNISAW